MKRLIVTFTIAATAATGGAAMITSGSAYATTGHPCGGLNTAIKSPQGSFDSQGQNAEHHNSTACG